jgi:Chain length determinant protein
MALRAVGQFVAKSLTMRPKSSVASPPPGSQAISNGELDLAALGAALLRKKWQILRPTILMAIVALIGVQLITPKYSSESRVFIEGRDNIYLRPDVDRDTTDRNAVDLEAVTSQAQIILSAPGMVTKFSALARSYDHIIVDAGFVAGPKVERIAEIAPHAVLVTDTLSNAATASAREHLLASGFGDVGIFVGDGGYETAAAA